MTKFAILLVSVLIVIFVFGSVRFNNRPIVTVNTPDSDLVVYWGEGCPHCENVKKYISDNQIDSLLKVTLKEVYDNQDNQKELQQIVKKCPQIDTSKGIGVPLSYFPKENVCLLGDQPVIDYLKDKVGQK